jgi:hypothetical protein
VVAGNDDIGSVTMQQIEVVAIVYTERQRITVIKSFAVVQKRRQDYLRIYLGVCAREQLVGNSASVVVP